MWNKKRFEFFTDSNEYFDGAEIKMLEILKQKGIVREPFFGRFIPQNKQNFELRLINVHNFRGGERKGISRRRSELSVLLQEIYPIFSEIETNIPSYTILMGDYNLELVRYDDELKKFNNDRGNLFDFKAKMDRADISDVNDIVVSTEYDNMRIITVQDERTTIGKKRQEGRYCNNFDHFSYDYDSWNARGIVSKADRVDCVKKYYDGDFYKYYSGEKVAPILTIYIGGNHESS